MNRRMYKTRMELVVHLEHSLDMPWQFSQAEQQDHMFDVLGMVAFSLDSHEGSYWEPYSSEIQRLIDIICMAMMTYENGEPVNLKNTCIEVQDKLADIAIRMHSSHEDMPGGFLPAMQLVTPIIDKQNNAEKDMRHQQKKTQILITQTQLHNRICLLEEAVADLIGAVEK